jgi:hypothetical protein
VWLLAFVVGTTALCWYVFTTFYRSDYGARPLLAGGCALLTLIGCLLGGLWLLVMGAIGGSVTL